MILYSQLILHYLFDLVNDLSFLVILSLVSMPLPGMASSIQQILLQFIYFDILMTSDWLVPWLVTTDDLTEADLYPNGFNDYFSKSGIAYMNLLKNLQSTLVYLVILAFMFGLSIPLYLLRKTNEVVLRLSTSLNSKLKWVSTLRFLIHQFQPIVMYSMINFYFVSNPMSGHSLL